MNDPSSTKFAKVFSPRYRVVDAYTPLLARLPLTLTHGHLLSLLSSPHTRTHARTHTHTHTHTHVHVELSEVLWLMVINMAIGLAVQMNSAPLGVILLFFLFAFWAGE